MGYCDLGMLCFSICRYDLVMSLLIILGLSVLFGCRLI